MNNFSRVLALALLAASGMSAQAQSLHHREGLSLTSGIESWKWVEHNEDGSEYLHEKGGPVFMFGAGYTFATHSNSVFHTVSLKTSAGEIDYHGAYIGGGDVQSITKYGVTRAEYEVAMPMALEGVNLEWVGALAYESRNRKIWNPAAEAYQVEDYQSGLARLGVQVPRPKLTGFYGSVGAIASFGTSMDPHATDLGLTTNPRLRSDPDMGYYAKVGYAFDRSLSVELSHELTKYKISNKAPVATKDGATGRIWQPAADLDRTTVQVVYRF